MWNLQGSPKTLQDPPRPLLFVQGLRFSTKLTLTINWVALQSRLKLSQSHLTPLIPFLPLSFDFSRSFPISRRCAVPRYLISSRISPASSHSLSSLLISYTHLISQWSYVPVATLLWPKADLLVLHSSLRIRVCARQRRGCFESTRSQRQGLCWLQDQGSFPDYRCWVRLPCLQCCLFPNIVPWLTPP